MGGGVVLGFRYVFGIFNIVMNLYVGVVLGFEVVECLVCFELVLLVLFLLC